MHTLFNPPTRPSFWATHPFAMATRPLVAVGFAFTLMLGMGGQVLAQTPTLVFDTDPNTGYMFDEGDREVMVTLNLTPALTENLTVNFETTPDQGGTNEATLDREFRDSSQAIVFMAGETQKNLTVRLLENDIWHRTNPAQSAIRLNANATLANGTVIMAIPSRLNIIDNDDVPRIVVTGPSRIAPGTNGTFFLRQTGSVSSRDTMVEMLINGSFATVYVVDVSNTTLPFVVNATANLTDPAGNNGTMFEIGLQDEQRQIRFLVEAAPLTGNQTEDDLDDIVVYIDPTSVRVTSTSPQYALATGSGAIAVARVGTGGEVNPIAVNEAIVPQAVAAVLDETNQAIASRSQNAFGDDLSRTRSGSSFTIQGQSAGDYVLGLAAREAQREAAENPWDAPGADSRASLVEMPTAGDLAFTLAINSGEEAGSFAVWGQGFTRSIDGTQSGVEFDGDIPGGVFGVDARVGENWLAGVGFSTATADFEFTQGTGNDSVSGESETELTGYHPYIGYRSEGGLNVWASLGIGEGEVTITSPTQATDYVGEIEAQSYGLGFTTLADAQRAGGEGLALNYHGDIQWANVEETPSARTRQSGEFADATGSEFSIGRTRLGATLSQTSDLDGGGVFRRSLDLALRHDSGDTAEGGAVEIAGEIGVDLAGGLKLDLTARSLIFHEEAIDDWGISGGFVWVTQPSGLGLRLAFTPSWGNSASQADALLGGRFGDGLSLPEADGDAAESEANYAFDARYGIPVLRDGVLTPFVSGDAGDASSVVYGSQYSFGGFAAGVEATTSASDADTAFLRYSREF